MLARSPLASDHRDTCRRTELSLPKHLPRSREVVCRLPVPTGRQGVALSNTFSILVHLAQAELCVWQSLCSGPAQPLERLSIIRSGG